MCAGVDFSSSMLQLAQANIDAFAAAKAKGDDDSAELPAVMLLPGDAHALPFQQSAVDEAGGLFDAVVCNFGVLHLGEPEKFFSEAFRLLRPGGKFGFTVWCAPPETEGFAITLVGTVPCPALPCLSVSSATIMLLLLTHILFLTNLRPRHRQLTHMMVGWMGRVPLARRATRTSSCHPARPSSTTPTPPPPPPTSRQRASAPAAARRPSCSRRGRWRVLTCCGAQCRGARRGRGRRLRRRSRRRRRRSSRLCGRRARRGRRRASASCILWQRALRAQQAESGSACCRVRHVLAWPA